MGGGCICTYCMGENTLIFGVYEDMLERLVLTKLIDITLAVYEICTLNLLGGGALPTSKKFFEPHNIPLPTAIFCTNLHVCILICSLVIHVN